MKQQRNTRSAPYTIQWREEAFDLYVTGLSRRQVHAELRQLYGDDAPSETSLKRWSVQDHWTERRARIRRRMRRCDDADRALSGSRMTEELRKLRRLVVDAVGDLNFNSAEGALFALAALERIIERHDNRQRQKQWQRSLQTVLEPLRQQSREQLADPEHGPGPYHPGLGPPAPSEDAAPT